MHRSIALVSLVTLVLCACDSTVDDGGSSAGGSGGAGAGGSGAGGSGTGGAGQVALDGLADGYAEVTCGSIFRCCDEAERAEGFAAFDPPITTEAECRASYAELLEFFLFAEAQRAVDAGTVRYDDAAAAACLQASRAAACGVAPGEVCDRVLVGLVAGGQPCASNLECAAGGICLGSDAGAGRCGAKPALGEPCPDYDCEDGSYCALSQDAATCVALEADGAACSLGSECRSGNCDRPSPQELGTCGPQGACNL